MQLIKLDAIDSTNTFLKALSASEQLESFTVVTAEKQTAGRGQMGSKWESKPSENLVFSVFVNLDGWLLSDGVMLNFLVSLSVFKALKTLEIPKLSIKWPNDILSVKNKICGILIENTLSSIGLKASIIGIGINVNQEDFPSALGKATSLKNILGRNIDRSTLLKTVVDQLKINIGSYSKPKAKSIKKEYLKNLYCYQKATAFEDAAGRCFMAIISGVADTGALVLTLADGSTQKYGLKEVTLLR